MLHLIRIARLTPILNPEIAPLVRGEPPRWARLWSGDIEWNRAALLGLGARAFGEWPAQRAPGFRTLLPSGSEPAATERARLAALGVWQDARGRLGGLVMVRYADGTTEPAFSCASCHARPNAAGRLVHGPASDLDLGSLVGEHWGRGRVDVTADAEDNPVSISDLRATRHQLRLHHTGNLHNSLEALAVRTETLLITARASAVRPPREVAFALAYYVWSLGESQPASVDRPPSPLFRAECARCHSGPSGAGEWVAADEVGTDPAAARSPARGTGGYRPPSIYRVSERVRLTHQGWPMSLEQFFEPDCLSRFPGHAFGLDLDTEQRGALLRELRSW